MYTYVDLPDENWRLSTSGIVYKTNKEKGIECYVDSEFPSRWTQAEANNAENVMLHTGYVITSVGCPVLWCSKLQTKNYFKYNRSGIYCIETGDVQRNIVYGADEWSFIYFWYSSSKSRSIL